MEFELSKQSTPDAKKEITFVVYVNGKPMNSGGDIYYYKTIKEAIRYVGICYGLRALISGEIEIKPEKPHNKPN